VKAAAPEPSAKAGCSARELRLGKPPQSRTTSSKINESSHGTYDKPALRDGALAGLLSGTVAAQIAKALPNT